MLLLPLNYHTYIPIPYSDAYRVFHLRGGGSDNLRLFMAKNDQTTHGPDVVIDFCGFLKIILCLVLNLLEKILPLLYGVAIVVLRG